MTKEMLKQLENKVLSRDLKVGICEPREKFDKEGFVKAAIAIQKSTEERDKNANSSAE